MSGFAAMRLGRIASGPTPHLPAFAACRPKLDLPTPPAAIAWGRRIAPKSWGMYANDRLGDCAMAGLAHAVMGWGSYHDGAERLPTEPEVIQAYRDLAGYDPARPETDRGACMADVLQAWKDEGVTLGGVLDKPLAFVRVEPKDWDEVRTALWLFGPLYVGVALPRTAQAPGLWRAPRSLAGDAAPGSWGLHCVVLTAIDDAGTATFITWGAEQQAERGWFSAYTEEAWAVLHPLWVAGGQSVHGFDLQALAADLPHLCELE